MGIDISKVEFSIPSRAHYDFSDSLKAFLKMIPPHFFMYDAIPEKCYHYFRFHHQYIGIHKEP